MDGTPGMAAGAIATIGSIAVAFIQRTATAGVREVRAELDKLIGPDNKCGPTTEIGKLVGRVVALEGAVPVLGPLLSLPSDFAALRTHVDKQLAAAASEWEKWKRAQQRAATGSLPAIVDEDARRQIEDVVRRLETIERDAREDREVAREIQLQAAKIDRTLELLVGGKIKS